MGDEISDEQLVKWHREGLSGAELAAREGVAAKWIYHQWERLRREGAIKRRSGGVAGVADNLDGRPSVGWFDDPLLARLIEVHGDLGRADLVDVELKERGRGRRRGAGAGSGPDGVRP